MASEVSLTERLKRRWAGHIRTLSSLPGGHGLNVRPAALVIGSGITALGVIRGLGLGGIRAIQVAYRPGSEHMSRYCSASFTLPKRPSSVEEYLEALNACAGKFGLDRAVVLPCSDEANECIARLPDEHRFRFPTSLPRPDTLAALTHKGTLARLLATHSVPHPRTRNLETALDLDLEPSEFRHAFLKPCESQSFFRAYGVKAISVKSREEALSRWREVSAHGHEMILQQYVSGPSSNHYFVDGLVDRHGVVKSVFVRHRLRMYPSDYGNSSYLVSASQEPMHHTIESLSRFLRAISYRGLFSAEFKRDEADGEYKLLEINCRPWWFIWFAQVCGLPLTEMAYADALDQPVPTLASYPVGVPLVYPYYDYNACRMRIAQGEMTWAQWWGSWLLARQAVFTWRDPVPSVVDLLGGVGRYLKGRRSNA